MNVNIQSDTILTDDSPFNMTEAYIRLRTNFLYITMNGTHKTVVFTSCESGEGKTTLALNLAISLARLDKKVLMLDCDIRKSMLRRYLGMDVPRDVGLSAVLSNLKQYQDCIVSSKDLGIDILFAGEKVPNPSELLSSDKMRELLAELSPQYDYILLDAPPVLSVSDPAILSTICDGTIFVVEHERIRKKQLAFALQALRNVDAKLLGTVLSQYDARKDRTVYGGYGGKYYYNYYYGGYGSYYGHDDDSKSKGK